MDIAEVILNDHQEQRRLFALAFYFMPNTTHTESTST
ncbi:UNVERIFIED_ORG: hypothetical protein ABIB52_001764 [Arthrobacter sp. UYCu721]